MISITGIPGSGKTSVCILLNQMGLDCRNVLDLEGATDCLEDEEMDIGCLREKIRRRPGDPAIIEGHYSHLLGCSEIFILERDEHVIRDILETRGYSNEKINENLDAMRSDIIYQESLEFLPTSRIHRIKVEEKHPEYAAKRIADFISNAKKD